MKNLPVNPPIDENSDAYQLRLSEHREEQLKKRFDQRSYCTQNNWLRTLCQYFSFTKHALSVLFGWAGAFYFFSTFMHWLAAGAIATVGLVLIEVTQRFSSDGFWDKFFQSHRSKISWGLLSLSIFCVGMNGLVTGYGYYQTTIRNAAAAPIIQNDSTLLAMNAQLAHVVNEIDQARATKWRGTTTVTSQRTIRENSKLRAKLTTAILEREATLMAKNDGITLKHETSVAQIAFIALLICLLIEVLFECAMAYSSYFDYRLYCELGLDKKTPGKGIEPTQENLPTAAQVKATDVPTYNLNEPAIMNRRQIGFRPEKTVSKQPETTVSENPKQPETEIVKQPETTVVQGFKPETTVSTQSAETTETPVSKHTETVVVVDSNEKYIRNKFLQAFDRKNVQKDPTTPLKNFKECGEVLEKLGYSFYEKGKGIGAELVLTNGEKEWKKVITNAKSLKA